MAEGVLATDGIPNLSKDDDEGEKGSSHPAAAHTLRSNSAFLIIHGVVFRHHWLPESGLGFLKFEQSKPPPPTRWGGVHVHWLHATWCTVACRGGTKSRIWMSFFSSLFLILQATNFCYFSNVHFPVVSVCVMTVVSRESSRGRTPLGRLVLFWDLLTKIEAYSTVRQARVENRDASKQVNKSA